jgi:hypothetical protein
VFSDTIVVGEIDDPTAQIEAAGDRLKAEDGQREQLSSPS